MSSLAKLTSLAGAKLPNWCQVAQRNYAMAFGWHGASASLFSLTVIREDCDSVFVSNHQPVNLILNGQSREIFSIIHNMFLNRA